MAIINIDDFFDFDYTGPVNRIAYTEEDAKYKLKCMKRMQDLGMKISIDDAGNICGTLKGNTRNSSKRSLLVGSHTDSVQNGGQFDGPVGVYMALKAAEDFKESSEQQARFGDLKVIIYAAEESTRFGTACLGSYYLNGAYSKEYLYNLKDKQEISFADAIADYKDYIFSHLKEYGIDLNNLELVDKVASQDQIKEALEAHIEQAETLMESNYAIGAVDSIVKPLRGEITVNGENAVVTAAKVVTDFNKLALEAPAQNQNEIYRISVPEFNSNTPDGTHIVKSEDNKLLLKVTSLGKNNHSGATPMPDRKDAVFGLANLILNLNELQQENPNLHFNFLDTKTPTWGPNQIQNNAELILQIEPEALFGIVKEQCEEVGKVSNVQFNVEGIDQAEVPNKHQLEMFVDVRQQYPATGDQTRDRIYDIFRDIQDSNKFSSSNMTFKIKTKDNPVQTSPELLDNIKQICDDKKIPCQIMHSWAGHDLACVLDPNVSTGIKVLFFIPSEGGSHNPGEKTSRQAIETGSDVFSTLVNQRMRGFEKLYEKEEKDSLELF